MPYLKSASIQNFFSISDIHLSGLDNYREIYFLGENGDGKTLLLQAIFYALKWTKIRIAKNQTNIGHIRQLIFENRLFNLSNPMPTEDSVRLNYKLLASNGDEYHKDSSSFLDSVFAYGVNRNQLNSHEFVDKEGYLTLFTNDSTLLHPVEWLRELDRLAYRRNDSSKRDAAINLLEDLLDGNVKISIDEEISFMEIRFHERNTPLRFEQLSEGFRSVMSWMVDLLSKLAYMQPEVKELKDYVAIVLVDEIELHLHPTWEIVLVKKLRNWFPKIQFIFTTHSPVLLLGASRDAVVYRLHKEEGVTKISEPYPCKDMGHLMLNEIVTSPLFDLQNAKMQSHF